MKFYFMVLIATGTVLAIFALENHDLFKAIGLLMAIIVFASFLTMLTRSYWVGVVVSFGVLGMIGNPEFNRKVTVSFLSSSYLYPGSVLAL